VRILPSDLLVEASKQGFEVLSPLKALIAGDIGLMFRGLLNIERMANGHEMPSKIAAKAKLLQDVVFQQSRELCIAHKGSWDDVLVLQAPDLLSPKEKQILKAAKARPAAPKAGGGKAAKRAVAIPSGWAPGPPAAGRSNTLCFKCGVHGHQAKDCRKQSFWS
jgi:hypothetical protein